MPVSFWNSEAEKCNRVTIGNMSLANLKETVSRP